jgi:beta-galactosidase/beta-glucuronidase
MADGPLKTRWAKDVSPKNAWPEYPRPQFVRHDWLSLNGIWELAICSKDAKPEAYTSQILVPFPVESALSGVMKSVSENEKLWYRRAFTVPRNWSGRRVMLNFGAVDFETMVWVNGHEVGRHNGGYDGFSLDITDTLKVAATNEVVVSVWDPTDAGTQPRGKQVRNPHGIWYTPTSGIWQSVWLEPVESTHIEELKITPDVDHGSVRVVPVMTSFPGHCQVELTVRDGGRTLGSYRGLVNQETVLPIKDPKLWSPEHPHLYGLVATLRMDGRTLDRVESYFGLRKISLGKDRHGFTRLLLNNEPYVQFGPLDQGFWPDGILYGSNR